VEFLLNDAKILFLIFWGYFIKNSSFFVVFLQLYFGFFVAAIAYKTVRDKRIENEEQSHK